MKTTQIFHICGTLVLTFGVTWAQAADIAQHKSVNEIEVFYGVVLPEVVQIHVKQHGEERMHGKSGAPLGAQHLVVTLYDVKTSERIIDATISATVTPLVLTQGTKPLEIMKINNSISYGNYFSMSPSDTPYRMALSIKRPPDHSLITTAFEYRHALSHESTH
jgi:hypothetical protein